MSKFALPTNEFLKYRRLSHIDYCARGCHDVETCSHTAVHCSYLTDIISKLRSWGFNIPTFQSLDCLSQLRILSKNSLNIVKIYCTAVFYFWKCQNDSIHGKSIMPVSVIAGIILSSTMNKYPMLVDWGTSLRSESSSIWHPPPLHWLKINVDAALLDSNLASIGGKVRYFKGRLLLAFGKKKMHGDINQLELEAISSLQEFLHDWMFDCKGIIIEGDNYNMIKLLQYSMMKSNNSANNLISEKMAFLQDFSKVIFHHIPRNAAVYGRLGHEMSQCVVECSEAV
ncbi:uncharacterized protein LOC110111773 [Dendrobium catenatum]|uniref:uncharacterized protein LOC110111773 n=1 Tax=Dendrobium catenatum TaxID=906689 RepID=UPI0009F4FD0D|nr:uncharacterized protein LOC110111773 [Dendrobium catenatum]